MDPLELVCTLHNNRLKERREAAGLSRSKLAESAGLSASIYGRLESLKCPPRKKNGDWILAATRLAHFYKTTEEDLFPPIVEKVQSSKISRRISDGEAASILNFLQADRESRTPEEVASQRETCRLLIDRCSECHADREVIVRHLMGGESTTNIARDLGVTKSAILQRSKRCLARMRSSIKFLDTHDRSARGEHDAEEIAIEGSTGQSVHGGKAVVQ